MKNCINTDGNTREWENDDIFKDVKKLSQEESQLLDAKITYREATDTLKHMNNDNSPGSNGFTTEFLNFF